MIEFTGTRDRAIYAARERAATIARFQSPRTGMSDLERLEPVRHHGDFWSQVPVVIFTLAAVVALFVVNHRTQAAAQPTVAAPIAPAVEVQLAPVGCPDCGEIIAVRPLAPAGAEGTQGAATEAGVLLDVRMSDGSIRTIKQLSTGFDVGDHVQVNGNALIARS